ncbi:MAG: hypothetical protein L6R39_004763 [Caloplaca ligustica]|nr:MAG: hypothetical protein L6R39_004763 [Caloplaca ligustica]
MSAKDFGGYKRIVQYFWDPEPKNDDPSRSPVWCLGRQYNSPSQADSSSSASEDQGSLKSYPSTILQESSVSQPDSQEPVSINGVDKTPSRANGVLGEDDRGWPPEFLDDFESRIWLTYRSGFPTIRRSDGPNASSSMTFAVRLRNWRRGAGEREERQLLSLFADDPKAPFSIHRFVEHGALACGKHPGEWFGPSATARCIQALAQSSVANELKVYINGDGADIYEDRFFSIATAEDGQFTPTLILVGIRLGIDRITPVYWEALKASLQLPQSVGIAGGRPSSSHYFVGVQGDNFFFLDPHQTRPALPRREDVTEYTTEEIDSCHTRFLIRDRKDWDEWRKSVSEVQGKPVVHVADKEPIMDRQEAGRQSAVDDVEILDDDDGDDGGDGDEGDGELIERP